MFKNIPTVLLLFSFIETSRAAVITFDPAPLPGGSRLETSHIESSVVFTGSFGFGSSANSGRASNASSGYLEFFSGSSLRFEMLDSSLFSLGSIDLSEYSTDFVAPVTITFTGYYSNGGSVSQSFTTDGLFDSVGGVDDFESFSFEPGFNNLAYVETSSVNYAMDNLEVNAVPLPGAIYLFLSGLIGLTGFTKSIRSLHCSLVLKTWRGD